MTHPTTITSTTTDDSEVEIGTTTATKDEDDDKEFTFTVAITALPPPATLSQLTNSIRHNTRTLRNRLHSIAHDSAFVSSVSAAYGLPLLPNLRAGDWYIPSPQRTPTCVYFKSTDGHTNEWSFSLRRLNLHLLPFIAAHDGACIVDSTRRGKRFPDALSKTLPIWIAVVNRLLFPGVPGAGTGELHTTPLAVAESERAAIERRIDGWVEEARRTLAGRELPVLHKPIRPIFVTPLSPLPEAPPRFEGFYPLVLITASRVVGGTGVEGEYIQGAGDDHEGWTGTSGLTPAIFWGEWHARIMAAGEDDIDDVVAAAVAAETSADAGGEVVRIEPTSCVYIAPRTALLPEEGLVVDCCETQLQGCGNAVHVPIPAGKRGNKALRTLVPPLMPLLRRTLADGGSVTFVCDSGDDVAAAVAVVCLCSFFDGEGVCLVFPFAGSGLELTVA